MMSRNAIGRLLTRLGQRNLVQNGGFLDEVHWAANTDKVEDLEWLDGIIPQVENYKKLDMTDKLGFENAWADVERGTMYIKIDDDVVRSHATCKIRKQPLFLIGF